MGCSVLYFYLLLSCFFFIVIRFIIFQLYYEINKTYYLLFYFKISDLGSNFIILLENLSPGLFFMGVVV